MLKLTEYTFIERKREPSPQDHRSLKELDGKQRLELEFKLMDGAMEVMRHMNHEDVDTKNKFESIENVFNEKEELEDIEALNLTRMVFIAITIKLIILWMFLMYNWLFCNPNW